MVRGLMSYSRAISLLESPAIRPSMTWRSRGLRLATRAAISCAIASLRAPGSACLSADVDHADQAVILERLFEEIDRAQLHGLDCERNVAMPGHDHDRKRAAARLQALQKLDAVDAGHADVGDDASKVEAGQRIEEMLGRSRTA